MDYLIWIIGSGLVFLTSIGQIFLKIGANSDSHLIINRYVFLGYGCFVSVIFLSALLMRVMEFKYFTVIVSLNYLVTTMLAIVILKERYSLRKILGCVLISLGALLFSL